MSRLTVSLLLAVMVAGCLPPTKKPADREAEMIQEIVDHKWWPKQPTNKQVSDMADEIVKLNASQELWITKDAKILSAATLPPGTLKSEIPSNALYFTVDIQWQSKRPDRLTVLQFFVIQLDRSELRDGPGR